MGETKEKRRVQQREIQSGDDEGRGPLSRVFVKCVLILTIVFFVSQRIALALRRDFDPDELQHLHGAFSMDRGLTPYVDYFEHHAPWFAGATSHLISSLGTTWTTLMAGRLGCGVLSILSAALTALLAARAAKAWVETPQRSSQEEAQDEIPKEPLGLNTRARVAWAAALAALGHETIITQLDKAIEIRPDVPATLFFLASLVAFLPKMAIAGALRSAVAGLLLGCGFMLTPKLAFAAIGLGVGALFAGLADREAMKHVLKSLTALTAASLVPLALTAFFLASKGHLDAFVRDVILGPLGWAREIEPSVHLMILLERNPLHVLFGTAGLLGLAASALRSRARWHATPGLLILATTASGIAVGWFLVPVPWPQFLLPLWPLLAIGIAAALDRIAGPRHLALAGGAALLGLAGLIYGTDLSESWARRAFEPAAWLVAGAAAVLVAQGASRLAAMAAYAAAAAAIGYGALTVQPQARWYGPLWLVVALLPMLAPRGRRSAAIAMAAIVAVPLVPMGRMLTERPHHAFRAEFRWIMENTGPDDTVLTGWRGCAVFRPHAYRYYFLHPGMHQMLSEEERGFDVLTALRASPPAVVIRDAATRDLSSEVQAWIEERYRPVGVGELWARTATPR